MADRTIMEDDILNWLRYIGQRASIDPHMYQRVETLIRDQEAEIARLVATASLAHSRGMEAAAEIVDLYAKAALKCQHCGDVCHDYLPAGCTGRMRFIQSDEYKNLGYFDTEYSKMRYFEKHLCRPEPMEPEEALRSLAVAIRAAATPGQTIAPSDAPTGDVLT